MGHGPAQQWTAVPSETGHWLWAQETSLLGATHLLGVCNPTGAYWGVRTWLSGHRGHVWGRGCFPWSHPRLIGTWGTMEKTRKQARRKTKNDGACVRKWRVRARTFGVRGRWRMLRRAVSYPWEQEKDCIKRGSRETVAVLARTRLSWLNKGELALISVFITPGLHAQ